MGSREGLDFQETVVSRKKLLKMLLEPPHPLLAKFASPELYQSESMLKYVTV